MMQLSRTHRLRRLSYVRPADRRPTEQRTLALDIGTSWIRGLVLDEAGWPVRPPHKLAYGRTPAPAMPERVVQAVVALIAAVEPFHRVSVGFPGRLCDGIVVQSPEMGSAWAGYPLAHTLACRLHCPVRAANATDIQGWGAICGSGVEMMMTLGPRLRASLFLDGVLIPDIRLGNHRLNRGHGGSTRLWSRRVLRLAARLETRFGYERLYLGGPYAGHVRATVLPPNVTIVASLNALLGGMALWQDREAW
ncbi:MAG TPA: ROK family protein [Nitrospira sp.]|nr:ROK family protein [Nitrospira sp.]